MLIVCQADIVEYWAPMRSPSGSEENYALLLENP